MAKPPHSQDVLRFLTCGSVDDGKSSLIGRLLFDTKQVGMDQIQALETEQQKPGSQPTKVNLALLLDGLAAEREQGITIDVAYRYFCTARRKFIVADTPGHEQYTRNMVTGASNSELAILVVDAQKPLQIQTKRHAYLASLLGIRNIVLAVNKMDLVQYRQHPFNQIEEAFRAYAANLNFMDIVCIPLSATDGDNVTAPSPHMSWYRGISLLAHLETVDINRGAQQPFLRFPVQWVNRPNSDFRGFAGTIHAGEVKPGDEITVLPSGLNAHISRIVTMDGDLSFAQKGQAVTLLLDTEIDISRGSILCDKDHPLQQSNQFQAHVIWMANQEMLPRREYRIQTTNQTSSASFTQIKHRINIDNMSKEAASSLAINQVGICNLNLGKAILFDPYQDNRQMGSFIVTDPVTNETVGAGMIDFSLYRAANLTWQKLEIGKHQRAQQKHQNPAVLWFTGLSGSGKSTIANLVEQQLYAAGRHTYLLDGDNVRHGLNRDLGFKDQDRVENIRRVAETAKLMSDAGLMVLVSFISPFQAERDMARALLDEGEFIEIFIDTPLHIAEARDVKGLYAKARAKQIKNFTGIDSEYQIPKNPEMTINTTKYTAEQSANQIIKYLQQSGRLS